MTALPSDAALTGTQARRAALVEGAGVPLRAHAAGGVLINAGFSLGVQGLSVLRGLVAAAFVSPTVVGAWSIIIVAWMTVAQLRQVGIGDKYIQQDAPDQETAFQHAFTLELLTMAVAGLVVAAITPLVAVAYDAPQVLGPGLVLLLSVPAIALQTPVWTFTRTMRFRRQRTLSAVDPLVATVVTIAAAAAGAGLWSFVIGSVAGAWTGAAVIIRAAEYPLRWRFDRAVAREYLQFSRPMFVAGLSSVVLMQGTLLVARSAVSIAGIGAMALSNSIRLYAEFADKVISEAMYPAVCAIKDRPALMFESFVKSNRLALMWGMPFGLGVALFTNDLLVHVLGSEWAGAGDILRAVGVASAIGHIAFNWDDYVRAIGDTRPVARYAWATLLGWGLVPIPLLIADGLRGYGIGLVAMAVATVVLRGYFLRRLFAGFALVPHVLRAILPSLPAVAGVLLLRALETGPRTGAQAAGEIALYVAVTLAATWSAERALLREAFGYLRMRRSTS